MNNRYDTDYVVTKTGLESDQSIIVPIISEERARKAYGLAESIYSLAEISAFRDKLHAALAKQAMDNTAMLATVEANYLQIAPGGRDEYRLIVQMYARFAISEMIGGEW